MARCSFCEETLRAGTGKMYVKKEGKLMYFCSGKCEKNLLKLRRRAVSRRWTRASRKRRTAAGTQASS